MTTLGNLGVRLDAETGAYVRGMSVASAATRSFGTTVQATSSRIGMLGAAITAGLVVPIAMFVKRAISQLNDFDASLTRTASIMDLTAAEADKLSDAAKKIGIEMAIQPTEIASAFEGLARNGYTATDILREMPAVAKFAKAGLLSVAAATDVANDLLNVLGMSSDNATTQMTNMTKVMDSLVAASRTGGGTVSEFVSALRTFGPVMRQYNIPLEESLPLLMAFHQQMIKGGAAGSMARMMLMLLGRSAKTNGVLMEQLGIQVFDASGNLRSFVDISHDLGQALNKLAPEERNQMLTMLGFSGRFGQAITAVAGMSAEMGTFREQIAKSGGATEDAFGKITSRWSEKNKRAWIEVGVAMLRVGEIAGPIVTPMVQSFGNVLERITRMTPEFRRQLGELGFYSMAGNVGHAVTAIQAMLTLTPGLQAFIMKWALIALGVSTALHVFNGLRGVIMPIVGSMWSLVTATWAYAASQAAAATNIAITDAALASMLAKMAAAKAAATAMTVATTALTTGLLLVGTTGIAAIIYHAVKLLGSLKDVENSLGAIAAQRAALAEKYGNDSSMIPTTSILAKLRQAYIDGDDATIENIRKLYPKLVAVREDVLADTNKLKKAIWEDDAQVIAQLRLKNPSLVDALEQRLRLEKTAAGGDKPSITTAVSASVDMKPKTDFFGSVMRAVGIEKGLKDSINKIKWESLEKSLRKAFLPLTDPKSTGAVGLLKDILEKGAAEAQGLAKFLPDPTKWMDAFASIVQSSMGGVAELAAGRSMYAPTAAAEYGTQEALSAEYKHRYGARSKEEEVAKNTARMATLMGYVRTAIEGVKSNTAGMAGVEFAVEDFVE